MVKGKRIALRMARLAEQQLVCEMGLGTDYMRERFSLGFPKGFASFAQSNNHMHFNHKAPSICGGMMISVGEMPVGFISSCSIRFGKIYLKPGIVELDIWMRSSAARKSSG